MVGSLVLEGAALERREQLVDVGDQQVGGAHELHVEAGVEHVGGGHALMHEARLGPDDLGEVGEEGDDVVLDLALDLVDARDVELGVPALVPDRLGRGLRDDAELGHGVGRVRLDLEPDAIARLRRPRSRPFRAGCSGGSWAALQARWHEPRCSRSMAQAQFAFAPVTNDEGQIAAPVRVC